ncbi:hypothetical protein F3I16_08450 [Pseudomonas sp. L-22-4S-12]|uniref:hypothetical protein n=1 Tax=Pseudomonas sp. L-22-4S-12 TaxID=2610893 RepID=UPI0013248601|nr:hypothetical protein [Pseudomonas sp. L-22-4S-12]MWV16078.1 hypothetical protein [Pseudomonas sp. L-22-4S-12]
MTWWIVVLLVGVALSPLVWLRPSRRQSGQMALRLAARRLGLGMQLVQQEWPHWLECSPPGSCAQYHRARRRGRQDSWCYWQAQPGQWLNQWREPCADEQLLAQLRQLPTDVYKVEAGPQMLALYWGERGGEAELQRVAGLLAELA